MVATPLLSFAADDLSVCFKNSALEVAKVFAQGNSHYVTAGLTHTFNHLPENTIIDVQYLTEGFKYHDMGKYKVVSSGGSLKNKTISSRHTLELKGTNLGQSNVKLHDRSRWKCAKI